MSSLRKIVLLDAYRRLSMPYRAWFMRRLIAGRRAPLILLYYHRVADRDPVPWSLTNRQFARQIDWLSGRFEMISIEEVQTRIAAGANDRPAVHVTFDDGYAENCEQALPLLIRRRIPCTYFVTLGNVQRGEPFEHDLAAGKRFPVNTIAQLRDLAEAGIEIGAHTRTHPDLGRVTDPDRLRDEVLAAGAELQEALRRRVRYFAFPFGMKRNLNRSVFPMLAEAGYEAVCSAYGGYNFPGDDPFHLQRAHGDPELCLIENIATLDPRKLRIGRYEYRCAEVIDHEPNGVGSTQTIAGRNANDLKNIEETPCGCDVSSI
jgi:peptidoglycan/xylan/chitin deacetylase (PgdA/CDA1 family)